MPHVNDHFLIPDMNCRYVYGEYMAYHECYTYAISVHNNTTGGYTYNVY